MKNFENKPFTAPAQIEENVNEVSVEKEEERVAKEELTSENAQCITKQNQKPVGRSLTDEEYEEIFSAVLSSTVPEEEAEESDSNVNNNSEHKISISSEKADQVVTDDKKTLTKKTLPSVGKSLTDEEYEEIFSAVMSFTVPEEEAEKSESNVNNNSEHKISISSEADQVVTDDKNTLAKKTLLSDRKQNFQENVHHKADKQHYSKKESNDRKKMMQDRVVDETGTWVQCSKRSCTKWRFLPDVHDPAVLPETWTCAMSADPLYNTCEVSEEEFDEEEHDSLYVFTCYTEGSVVWAHMAGYPWWPAMVEVDPDYESYFECRKEANVASHYHVVFFDDRVSRAWIVASSLMPFTGNEDRKLEKYKGKQEDAKKAVLLAKKMASDALTLSITERLEKYSFAKRFKGKWASNSQESKGQPKKQGSQKNHRKRKHDHNKPNTSWHDDTQYEEFEFNLDPDLKGQDLFDDDDDSLINSTDAILKEADCVLSELFSSQNSEIQSKKKKKKKGDSDKVESPYLDPDVFTMMDIDSQLREPPKKARKLKPSKPKDKKPKKPEFSVKKTERSKGTTSDEAEVRQKTADIKCESDTSNCVEAPTKTGATITKQKSSPKKAKKPSKFIAPSKANSGKDKENEKKVTQQKQDHHKLSQSRHNSQRQPEGEEDCTLVIGTLTALKLQNSQEVDFAPEASHVAVIDTQSNNQDDSDFDFE